MKSIRDTWGVSAVEVRRLFQRCIALHYDGRIYGYRALINRVQLKPYTRRVPSEGAFGTKAGELTRVFETYPHIEQAVVQYFLGQYPKGTAKESRVSLKKAHSLFVEQCRMAKIPGTEYPFNTKEQGRRAIGFFLRSLAAKQPYRYVVSQEGTDAAKMTFAGGHTTNDLPAMRPYARVLFDGHRLDALFTLEYLNPLGMMETKIVERPWLLLIMDAYSRVILAWSLVIKSDYNQDDVLECVQKLITPWKSPELTIPGLQRTKGSGMPTELFDKLHWRVPTELWLDNARAHFANQVREKLVGEIGIHVNAGPVRTPQRRGILERLFQTLEEDCFHRLPSTTGSGISDSRRESAVQNAIRFKVKQEHLEELLDVTIGNYNAMPHTSLHFKSPLEVIAHHLEQENSNDRYLTSRQAE